MLYSKNVAMVVTGAALALTIGLVGCGGQKPQTTTETTTTEQTTTSAPAEQTTSDQSAAPAQETTTQNTQATTENTQTTTEAPKETAPSYIGDAEAKRIALEHAGLAESDCYELESELDLDGVAHYDVDFKSGGMEYDYDIDAVTGAIINSHAEVDD